jgi:hypothetical protein
MKHQKLKIHLQRISDDGDEGVVFDDDDDPDEAQLDDGDDGDDFPPLGRNFPDRFLHAGELSLPADTSQTYL